MPRNGSGQFVPITNSWYPPVNGVLASAADFQAQWADVASALTASVAADGQTPMTGNLPMGGNQATNLGAPTGNGQALRWEQLTKGSDIASAATITIPNEGAAFDITGNTTIGTINDAFVGKIAWLRFNARISLTNSASLILPYGRSLVAYPGEVYAFCNIAPGIWKLISGEQILPTLYRAGGRITHTTTAITVAAGMWRDRDDSTNMNLTSNFSKTLAAGWTAGSGNNGLFAGSPTNSTWYHAFVIRSNTTGAVDVGFDTSPIPTNLPSGYSCYRRIGSVFRNGSGVIQTFIQVGDYFLYSPQVTAVSNISVATTDQGMTLITPAGVRVKAMLTVTMSGNGGLGVTVTNGGATSSTGDTAAAIISISNSQNTSTYCEVICDTARQVVIRATNSVVPNGFYCNVRGYQDFLED